MTSTSQGWTPPPSTPPSGWRRWWPWAIAAAVVLVALGVLAWWFFLRVDFGNPTRRVASPTGEYEVVQYEFSAVIDPGWNLAIERVNGDRREWFWRSVEGPGPESIRFSGPTSIELIDEYGGVYRLRFNPDTLEPSDRFCLRPEYCYSAPWDGYTQDAP